MVTKLGTMAYSNLDRESSITPHLTVLKNYTNTSLIAH